MENARMQKDEWFGQSESGSNCSGLGWAGLESLRLNIVSRFEHHDTRKTLNC